MKLLAGIRANLSFVRIQNVKFASRVARNTKALSNSRKLEYHRRLGVKKKPPGSRRLMVVSDIGYTKSLSTLYI